MLSVTGLPRIFVGGGASTPRKNIPAIAQRAVVGASPCIRQCHYSKIEGNILLDFKSLSQYNGSIL